MMTRNKLWLLVLRNDGKPPVVTSVCGDWRNECLAGGYNDEC